MKTVEVLKHENKAEVGDSIRAYDFPGIDNYYLEGIVLRKGDVHPGKPGVKVFECRCTKAVREGEIKNESVGTLFYTPFEVGFLEFGNRIEKLEERIMYIEFLSKEKHYYINGRRGQYELSTTDGKSHCFFMDDSNVYEYFPITTLIREDV
jgi:hypothetical protein